MRRLGRLALPLLVLLGCGDATGPVAGDEVRVQLTAVGATARNGTPATAYYFVVERETAALINWAGCTDPDHCPGIAPGASVTVPYAQIFGWPGSGELIFYWWHLVPNGTGSYRMDSLHAVVATR